MMEHLIDIDISTKGGTSSTNQLASADVVELFQNIAKQYGFVVESAAYPQYRAIPPKNTPSPLGNCWIDLYIITEKQVAIYCYSETGGKSFDLTKKIAASFEQELDKRGIQYRATTRTANPLNY